MADLFEETTGKKKKKGLSGDDIDSLFEDVSSQPLFSQKSTPPKSTPSSSSSSTTTTTPSLFGMEDRSESLFDGVSSDSLFGDSDTTDPLGAKSQNGKSTHIFSAEELEDYKTTIKSTRSSLFEDEDEESATFIDMGSTTSLFTKKTKPSKKEEEQEEDEEEEVQEDEEDEDTKLCNEMVAPHSLSSEERDKKFVSLFQTGAGDWYSLIQDTAVLKSLKETTFRSVCWKLFLECISEDDPPEKWVATHKKHRTRYDKLVAEHFVDPRLQNADDLEVHNPLSQAINSPWKQFFQDSELQKFILRDLDRVFPELQWFQTSEIKEMMMRVLFVWAKLNPDILYKQGMHEILALIVTTLKKDSVAHDPKYMFTSLCDERYIEHDSYWMLNKVMSYIGKWYRSEAASHNETSLANLLGDDVSKLDDRSPVVAKAKFIHHTLLKKKDKAMYENLQKHEIQPQLYVLRWVRLLFAREFHLYLVPDLWDVLFGFKYPLTLLDSFCISLLLYMRDDLMLDDISMVFRRLLNFPRTSSIREFVESAIQASDPKYFEKKKIMLQPLVKPTSNRYSVSSTPAPSDPLSVSTPSVAPSNPLETPISPRSSEPPQEKLNAGTTSAVTGTIGSLYEFASPKITKIGLFGSGRAEMDRNVQVQAQQAAFAHIQHRLLEMEGSNKHAAARIDRIIFCLQAYLRMTEENAKESGLEKKNDSEGMLLSIAELKQIRDVLSGSLPAELETLPDYSVMAQDSFNQK
eukprot:CAMPEP_0201492740 /NCGR_PEP_ID=MMETSP0151_2-20130828/34541_1 /ASSEMBLY_ACC=CAM_ASM_000257 /TAXON_ID=200890 /ORGANISM="Paramoeba atlantica, Strain 621/1 / CCAP 1560/9" /LENGTH=744 /DNA_ID=CAMNT_0047879735 /DNA_START=88 /DNA_END=2322 /DNA_ORIENTATION=+